jgi:hypothetical protein
MEIFASTSRLTLSPGLGLEEWVTDIDDTDPADFEGLIDPSEPVMTQLITGIPDAIFRARVHPECSYAPSRPYRIHEDWEYLASAPSV